MLAARRAQAGSAPLVTQMRSALSRIQSLSESLEATQVELERLSNRVKMQRVRNVTEHGQATPGPKPPGNGAMPDPYTQKDEWRHAMNKRLAESKLGVKL